MGFCVSLTGNIYSHSCFSVSLSGFPALLDCSTLQIEVLFVVLTGDNFKPKISDLVLNELLALVWNKTTFIDFERQMLCNIRGGRIIGCSSSLRLFIQENIGAVVFVLCCAQ